MVVEIVEEAACDGALEKDDEQHREEHEADMSWDSSFSSAFKLSSSGIGVNASDDLLWNEIELAERYMVSAMYEDAASTASIVLQTLSSLMHTSSSGGFCSVSCRSDKEDAEEESNEVNEVGKSDHEAMLDSAGMVLLQSYHALGRVSEFFDTLRSLNIGVGELPPTLLLSGTCLQISAGAFPAARAALEEFFTVWNIASSEELDKLISKPTGVDQTDLPGSSANKCAFSKMCTVEEKYADIVEVYVFQVLVKGLQDTDSALDWVQRANLTEERRVVILKKVQLQIALAKTELAQKAEAQPALLSDSATTPSDNTSSPAQAFFNSKEFVKKQDTIGRSDEGYEASNGPDVDESSLHSKSLALFKRLKVSEGFFSIRTLLELALARLNATTEWQPLITASLEGRALGVGALVALFLFLLLRQRHTLRRLAGQSYTAIIEGLKDFWQLAFSVQINPLAAVNPISTAAY